MEQCRQCPARLDRATLSFHESRYHVGEPQPLWACPRCTFRAPSCSLLIAHRLLADHFVHALSPVLPFTLDPQLRGSPGQENIQKDIPNNYFTSDNESARFEDPFAKSELYLTSRNRTSIEQECYKKEVLKERILPNPQQDEEQVPLSTMEEATRNSKNKITLCNKEDSVLLEFRFSSPSQDALCDTVTKSFKEKPHFNNAGHNQLVGPTDQDSKLEDVVMAPYAGSNKVEINEGSNETGPDDMILSTFYRTVGRDDETITRFLQSRGLLPSASMSKPCSKCGSEMKEFNRRMRDGRLCPSLRCSNRSCMTSRSLRDGTFFAYANKNGRPFSKLDICSTVKLVYLWSLKLSYGQIEAYTGHSANTIVDWSNFCRDICSDALGRLPTWTGTKENPIQIDVSLFAGRRKDTRGRLRKDEEKTDDDDGDSEDGGPRKENQRRWVFGLYQHPNRTRFFLVTKRNAQTLVPLIEKTCAPGSVIHSDGWKAFDDLSNHGFAHFVVNHSDNFFYPETGSHTQGMERDWCVIKREVVKKGRGSPMTQGHFDEASYRLLHKDSPDLFLQFLSDIKAMHINKIMRGCI